MDIIWTGCDHTQIGQLPGGMTIVAERQHDGVYLELGNEPVMDIFDSMEEAKDKAELIALPFVRHLSAADNVNARLEGYML